MYYQVMIHSARCRWQNGTVQVLVPDWAGENSRNYIGVSGRRREEPTSLKCFDNRAEPCNRYPYRDCVSSDIERGRHNEINIEMQGESTSRRRKCNEASG